MAKVVADTAQPEQPQIVGGAAYLAHKHGLTTEQVIELAQEVGTVKYKLDAAAEKLREEIATKDDASSSSLVGRLKEIVGQ